MNFNLIRFVIIFTSLITLSSCMKEKNKYNNSDLSSSAQTTADSGTDFYHPGDSWKLVWSDEFDGEAINSQNWNYQVLKAGTFNDEWQRYTDSQNNAFIEDSCLVITAIHESEKHGMDQYTSARLNTANKHSWKYGRIAARMKLPRGKGIWPAFWMLGANIDENGGDTPWPHCGEIDIMEFYGSKDESTVEANIHYADKNGKHAHMGAVKFKLDAGTFADGFHIFELEWDIDHIAWYVDGELYHSTSISKEVFSEFHHEFFILLNMAVGGTYAGRPDKTTPFPQFLYIDWVRVYQKKA